MICTYFVFWTIPISSNGNLLKTNWKCEVLKKCMYLNVLILRELIQFLLCRFKGRDLICLSKTLLFSNCFLKALLIQGILELQLSGRRGINPPWARDYIPNKGWPITGSQSPRPTKTKPNQTKQQFSLPTFLKKKQRD